MTYEQQLQELEALIQQLERGDLPLEQALQTYERGVALVRMCQSQLKAAEQRILVLQQSSHEPIPYEAKPSALPEAISTNPTPRTPIKKPRKVASPDFDHDDLPF